MTNKKISIDTTNDNLRINLTNKCNSCSHKEVCKYKEEFEKFMEEIKNRGIKIPKMFNLDITCSKYSSCYGIRTIDTTPQISPLPQIVPLSTPGVVPAPNYTPGITPSITTPVFDEGNFPKTTCELTDGTIDTATITAGEIKNKGTISLRN